FGQIYMNLQDITRVGIEAMSSVIGTNIENSKSGQHLRMGRPAYSACDRLLLCEAHQNTSIQQQYPLLPYWTLGVSWLFGENISTVHLLEDLRAELAGTTNNGC
ncbi:unnamed protein product, partial [Meganyctiphanes norvegica]